MFKHLRRFLTPSSVAIYTIALSLCSCATVTKSSSQARVQQLEDAHLAFIDHYTCVEGTKPTWDQGASTAKWRGLHSNSRMRKPLSRRRCLRKEFIKNSAKLFQRDAALVRKQHCLSPSFAANKKKQLQQNYDLLQQQTSS